MDDNPFLLLYKCFVFIRKQHSDNVINSNTQRILTNSEIEAYRINVNYIWYAIDCSNYFINEINDRAFDNLIEIEINRIKGLWLKIDSNNNVKNISIQSIANTAGDIEVDIINNLYELRFRFDKPIDKQ